MTSQRSHFLEDQTKKRTDESNLSFHWLHKKNTQERNKWKIMMLLRSWEDNADKSSQVKVLFNMYRNIDQCMKNEEILNGELHFLCTDLFIKELLPATDFEPFTVPKFCLQSSWISVAWPYTRVPGKIHSLFCSKLGIFLNSWNDRCPLSIIQPDWSREQ